MSLIGQDDTGLARLLEDLYPTRRKVFISYHHVDEERVRNFVDYFDSVFIAKGLGLDPRITDDLINSDDEEYVIECIRREILADSTVTIALMGECTWARRYVDWELKASLRSGDVYEPNGVLGIRIAPNALLPHRLWLNTKEPSLSDLLVRTILSPPQPTGLLGILGQSPLRPSLGAGLQPPAGPYARVHGVPQSAQELRSWIEDAFAARSSRRHLIENPREAHSHNIFCGHDHHM